MANAATNWLDRAIGFFSPREALRRVQYRRALGLVERFNYEGGMMGRRTGGWVTSNSDANRETHGSMVWLRNRARDLVRNNPFAAKALSELIGNQVGTGILPRADTGSGRASPQVQRSMNRSPVTLPLREGDGGRGHSHPARSFPFSGRGRISSLSGPRQYATINSPSAWRCSSPMPTPAGHPSSPVVFALQHATQSSTA